MFVAQLTIMLIGLEYLFYTNYQDAIKTDAATTILSALLPQILRTHDLRQNQVAASDRGLQANTL